MTMRCNDYFTFKLLPKRDVFTCARFLLFLLFMPLLLNACSDEFLGIVEEDLILKGKRERVFETKSELKKTSSVPFTISPVVRNSNWTQTGYNLGNSMANFDGNSRAKIIKTIDIGEGSSDKGILTALPVVAHGLLYTMDAQANIRAFDIEKSFKQVFKIQLEYKKELASESYGGGLAFDGNSLIATTGYGVVYNINARNGDIRWRKSINLPIRSHPKIYNGLIYILAADNTVYCLTLKSGRVIWSYKGIPGSFGVLSPSVVAVAKNVVVAPLSTGELLALNMKGIPKWNEVLINFSLYNPSPDINEIAEMPVIKNDRVFAASHSGYIGAFDIENGEKIWTLPIESTVAPTITGNYLVTVSKDKLLYAIHLGTGRIGWITQLPRDDKVKNVKWNRPLLVGGKLLVSSSAGLLLTISPVSGIILRRYKLKNPIFNTAIVADGLIYITTDNGKLIILQ